MWAKSGPNMGVAAPVCSWGPSLLGNCYIENNFYNS